MTIDEHLDRIKQIQSELSDVFNGLPKNSNKQSYNRLIKRNEKPKETIYSRKTKF